MSVTKKRSVTMPPKDLRNRQLERYDTMSDGLTLSATGAAELSNADSDELVAKMRAIVQGIEDLYRPTRAMMPSDKAITDPVLLALYGARDSLIEAENCILRIGLEPAKESPKDTVTSVNLDFDDVFDHGRQQGH